MSAVLALDIGGSHFVCGLVSGGVVIGREQQPIADASSFTALLPAIEAGFYRLLGRTGVTGATRLGIAFPALLDHRAGLVTSTPAGKFDDAVGFDFAGWAAARLGVEVRLELDTRMALLGERHAGALAGIDDAVMLTIGTGLGTAVLSDGRLLRGEHFQAGVLGGHLSTAADGAACICGGRGCLETQASTWALPGLAAALPGFAQSSLRDSHQLDFAALFAAAAAGDAVALTLRDRCIGAWSVAVLNLVHAYDPDVVVIGGGVMAAAALIVPRIADHVARYGWLAWGVPDIRAAACGSDAPLLGAEALWLDAW